mmetsp:Transcript_69442/g.111943  ORF Transcript_69442/g.111943 Transcript_69442/m.111943 type:complete len:93 (+) Transcript_69442:323-601(+)
MQTEHDVWAQSPLGQNGAVTVCLSNRRLAPLGECEPPVEDADEQRLLHDESEEQLLWRCERGAGGGDKSRRLLKVAPAASSPLLSAFRQTEP